MMTISGILLASGMWLAWEGFHAAEHSAGFKGYRALYCVGALLACAALGLAAMGYIAYSDAHDNGMLIAMIAFPAAIALGIGATAVLQAAARLRRKVACEGIEDSRTGRD